MIIPRTSGSIWAFLTCLFLILIMQTAAGNDHVVSDEQLKSEEIIATEMVDLIKKISEKRYPDSPIKRFNQVKSLGCVNADFHVETDIPEYLQQGLFSQSGSHRAELRFANARKEDDSKKDLRGMSIKVFDVKGTPLWGKRGVQDFLLNSYPSLFAATPEDFLQFIQAVNSGRGWWYFINPFNSHLGALKMLIKARNRPTSPLDIRYWSTTPFQLGTDKSIAVKYSVQSCSAYQSVMPEKPGENYLTEAMQAHLDKESACFEFMLQRQTDQVTMPIEDTSVIWDEDVSPFIKVATITIPQQSFLSTEARNRCEQMSFNPWQSLPEHKPLGGMNRVRNKVYGEISQYRVKKPQTE